MFLCKTNCRSLEKFSLPFFIRCLLLSAHFESFEVRSDMNELRNEKKSSLSVLIWVLGNLHAQTLELDNSLWSSLRYFETSSWYQPDVWLAEEQIFDNGEIVFFRLNRDVASTEQHETSFMWGISAFLCVMYSKPFACGCTNSFNFQFHFPIMQHTEKNYRINNLSAFRSSPLSTFCLRHMQAEKKKLCLKRYKFKNGQK